MATPIPVRVTPQGVVVPRSAVKQWLERGIEVIMDEERIIIRPKPAARTERERVLQVLESAGLLTPAEPLGPNYVPVSAEERARLAEKFSAGPPLSEIIIEERGDRA